MPAATPGQRPSLSTFLKSLKHNSVESSIELLVSLLKRRQIRNSRQCALATAQLLLRVVAAERIRDAQKLIDRIRHVGQRLGAAQPRELAVTNIVRRILAVVREVAEDQINPDGSADSSGGSAPMSPAPGEARRPNLPHNFSGFNPLSHGAAMPLDMNARPRTPLESSISSLDGISDSATSRRPALGTSASYAGQGPQNTSLLSFLEHPLGRSPGATPPANQSPRLTPIPTPDASKEKVDIKAEVIDGIKELLDELEVVDSQIAEAALEQIHTNDTILTHTSSQTVQAFLATAARKRKFTVVHVETYPNDHEATHATILQGGKKTSGDDDGADDRWKPLTAMGITVILIPDTAVYALMSRIDKVFLAPHAVLANGSLLAAAGASTIAMAAQAHHKPVVVLSGVYKLSPVYPFDTQELIEYGDPGKVVGYEEGEFMDKVDVVNPLFDWVDAELVNLYVTNLGGCAPSYLYRIVADHYRVEDIDLGSKSS